MGFQGITIEFKNKGRRFSTPFMNSTDLVIPRRVAPQQSPFPFHQANEGNVICKRNQL
jgi:hypothetical protein